MRIRHKPWAKPELDACPFCIENPQEFKDKWNTVFENNSNPIYLELGCGKGGFISQMILIHPEINFIAIDIKNEMLALAKRKIEKSCENFEKNPDNIKIFIQNIEQIQNTFGENDRIDRIYINFCNPWNKNKHKKRRLTHPRQLINYKKFLKGEIWFKTDDDQLFKESLDYFREADFKINFITWDLHNEKNIENIITEHEKMFADEGKNIKFLIAEPENNHV